MSRFSRKPTTRDEIEREIHDLMAALDELKHDATRGSRHRFDSACTRRIAVERRRLGHALP